MRHGNKQNHLGRKYGHREALLKNLSCSLIIHKRINTTIAKAKVLRTHLEPIITKAKNNTTHSRRTVFSYLQDNEATKELFGIIAEKIADRPGGYLRVIKTGFRLGDGAATAMIEFVDFNDVYSTQGSKSDANKKRTRRSRGAKKGSETTAGAPVSKTSTVAANTQDDFTDYTEETENTAPIMDNDVATPEVENTAVEETNPPVEEENAAEEAAAVEPEVVTPEEVVETPAEFIEEPTAEVETPAEVVEEPTTEVETPTEDVADNSNEEPANDAPETDETKEK